MNLPSAVQRVEDDEQAALVQVLGELLEQEVDGYEERLGCWSAIVAKLLMVMLAGWLSLH